MNPDGPDAPAAPTTPDPGLLGVVLAGGESRRFGSPKAFAPVSGFPLWIRAGRLLHSVGLPVHGLFRPETIQQARATESPDDWSLGVDRRPGRGPLAGIETGLLEARARGLSGILVLACDLARVGRPLLSELLRAPVPSRGVRAFAAPGPWNVEPLCAVWRTDALAAVQEELETGRGSPGALLDRVPIERLDPSAASDVDPADLFRSVNHPEDLTAMSPATRRSAGLSS